MNNYIVCSSRLLPSKVKGDLPDVLYTYIANDSHIGWHYTLTNNRENAYVFDESEKAIAEFLSDCWKMQIKKLI